MQYVFKYDKPFLLNTFNFWGLLQKIFQNHLKHPWNKNYIRQAHCISYPDWQRQYRAYIYTIYVYSTYISGSNTRSSIPFAKVSSTKKVANRRAGTIGWDTIWLRSMLRSVLLLPIEKRRTFWITCTSGSHSLCLVDNLSTRSVLFTPKTKVIN